MQLAGLTPADEMPLLLDFPTALQVGSNVALTEKLVFHFCELLRKSGYLGAGAGKRAKDSGSSGDEAAVVALMADAIPEDDVREALRALRGVVRMVKMDSELLTFLKYPWSVYSDLKNETVSKIPLSVEQIEEALLECGRRPILVSNVDGVNNRGEAVAVLSRQNAKKGATAKGGAALAAGGKGGSSAAHPPGMIPTSSDEEGGGSPAVVEAASSSTRPCFLGYIVEWRVPDSAGEADLFSQPSMLAVSAVAKSAAPMVLPGVRSVQSLDGGGTPRGRAEEAPGLVDGGGVVVLEGVIDGAALGVDGAAFGVVARPDVTTPKGAASPMEEKSSGVEEVWTSGARELEEVYPGDSVSGVEGGTVGKLVSEKKNAPVPVGDNPFRDHVVEVAGLEGAVDLAASLVEPVGGDGTPNTPAAPAHAGVVNVLPPNDPVAAAKKAAADAEAQLILSGGLTPRSAEQQNAGQRRPNFFSQQLSSSQQQPPPTSGKVPPPLPSGKAGPPAPPPAGGPSNPAADMDISKVPGVAFMTEMEKTRLKGVVHELKTLKGKQEKASVMIGKDDARRKPLLEMLTQQFNAARGIFKVGCSTSNAARGIFKVGHDVPSRRFFWKKVQVAHQREQERSVG